MRLPLRSGEGMKQDINLKIFLPIQENLKVFKNAQENGASRHYFEDKFSLIRIGAS